MQRRNFTRADADFTKEGARQKVKALRATTEV